MASFRNGAPWVGMLGVRPWEARRLTWTPTAADIGYDYAEVAVTNASGTTYVAIDFVAAFASPVTNVSVTGSLAGGTIDVSWSPPATAYEPIAGYDVEFDWTDASGVAWSTFASTAPGVTSFSLAGFPGVVTYTVTVDSYDAASNLGAPSASTTITLA